MNDATAAASKTCAKCQATKPITAFAKASWCADGRRNTCKECRGAKRVETAEKECPACGLIKPAEGYQQRSGTPDGLHQRCRDCVSAYRKAYYPSERERVLASNHRRYVENRAAWLASVAKWQAANPDRRRAYSGKRRALLAENGVGPVDLDALWTGLCGLCGLPIDRSLRHPDPMSKSLDHTTPISLGGSHEQSNRQWAHLRCNVRKGNRPST